MFDHQLRDTVPLSSTPHMLFPPASFPLPPILQPGDPSLPPSFEALWAEQRVGQPSTVRPQQPKDDINMRQPSNSNSEPPKTKQNKQPSYSHHNSCELDTFLWPLFLLGRPTFSTNCRLKELML